MSRLDDVEVFLRVVERGSFNGAAEQLGMPATSVSRKIKALEDRLGVQLLHRTTRKVWPSEAGQAYYRKCVDAMAALDHADAAIRALTQEPEGPLKVLITYAPAILILEPELATFRARYPKVQLHLTLDNHPLDLIEHGFDVGVRTGPVRDSSYHVRRLGQQNLSLIASPSYLDRRGRPMHPSDLAGHDLIAIRSHPGPLTWDLDGPSGPVSLKITPRMVTNDAIMALRQTIGGAGILMMSRCLARRRLDAGELEDVLPDWQRQEPLDTVALFPARATLDLKVRVFVDFMVEAYQRWLRADGASAQYSTTPSKA
ncbi:LysR family transcriptional regulator [Aquabacter sp. L1I39]|uniref:LysR family transcriptional regulator n=1 Tax=Aquabacter sp. L1I39 TaxID=2820278 RepID=UPI001AD96743|nr:LysR family transcriptional regulator [Aquabacter sp. L1I39]QTL04229.1 LysR family transcriptional regulator [Aquabacter sp. L1I39]